jgi:hypothetical protein
MFEMKPLSPDSLESAQSKAVRYRLLNEPKLAESVCRDILAVDPRNRDATITLMLSLCDQFRAKDGGMCKEALGLVVNLESEYERLYYTGVVFERRAIGKLEAALPGSGHMAYELLVKAMGHFEAAEALSLPDNDDAVLRWNTCARIINSRSDVTRAPEYSMPRLQE